MQSKTLTHVNISLAFLKRLARAATIIQAFIRGSKERQSLRRAEWGITLLQRKFRQSHLDKRRMKAEEKERRDYKLAFEQKRINEFRSSMRKQLKMLETVPAREVNLFMAQNQEQAASKIQAAYRGMVARRIFRERRHDVTRERAAVAIQRQVVSVKCMWQFILYNIDYMNFFCVDFTVSLSSILSLSFI